jgi:hypothetical protein
MTDYTVFLRGFENQGSQSGLTLSRAFSTVSGHCGLTHTFERRGNHWVLVFAKHFISCSPPPATIESRVELEGDAKRELMSMALDGRLSGFCALPDTDFLTLLKLPAQGDGA